jgi:hypothetical protein
VKRELLLRPLLPGDYRRLYEFVQHPGVGDRWRFNSGVPPFEQFVEGLWDGVLLQTVICCEGADDVAGLVSAYNADFRNGTVEIALVQRPDLPARGVAIVGLGAFLGELFATWPFRYAIFEVYDFSLPSIASGLARFADRRGVLKDDLYVDGVYHDRHIFTLDRDFLDRM